MKVLIFCPTAPRIEPETVNALLKQKGIEYFDLMLTHDNPYKIAYGETYRNVQLNYEKMRKVALNQNYDKICVIESDVIPPEDCVEKLLAVDAPIVSGLYALRQWKPSPNIMEMKWKDIQAHWGETVEIKGGCMGCIMIDHSVLEKFSFICKGNEAPDVPLMQWCHKNSIKQVGRFDVVCGHKRPNGEIIWPDKKLGYRIEKN